VYSRSHHQALHIHTLSISPTSQSLGCASVIACSWCRTVVGWLSGLHAAVSAPVARLSTSRCKLAQEVLHNTVTHVPGPAVRLSCRMYWSRRDGANQCSSGRRSPGRVSTVQYVWLQQLLSARASSSQDWTNPWFNTSSNFASGRVALSTTKNPRAWLRFACLSLPDGRSPAPGPAPGGGLVSVALAACIHRQSVQFPNVAFFTSPRDASSTVGRPGSAAS